MKTYSFKLYFVLLFIFLLNSTLQAHLRSSLNPKTENQTKAVLRIEKTEMDLQAAIISDNPNIVKALPGANTEPELKNNERSAALLAVALFCRIEIVKMLPDAGVDKSIKNNHNATPGESVTGPFAEMKPIYEMMRQQLAPPGLSPDLKELEETRPFVAMILK